MAVLLETERLRVRDWSTDDADDALAVYGDERVSRWLSPAMSPVPDVDSMRGLLQRWVDEQAEAGTPCGRWAVERRDDGVLVGALVLRRMPPYHEDIEIAWQLAPEHWGHGYATEAAQALARWAFRQSAHELYAVVRPANERGVAMAKRMGMEWVGETEKYYDLLLQVYRLRPADLAA
ncbi:MAG TPA: GNAT family N-acetyltransferase [Jiangellales bacterium]|nr:GNAT family N-acetyltransferase [Jiangellales bacterium]